MTCKSTQLLMIKFCSFIILIISNTNDGKKKKRRSVQHPLYFMAISHKPYIFIDFQFILQQPLNWKSSVVILLLHTSLIKILIGPAGSSVGVYTVYRPKVFVRKIIRIHYRYTILYQWCRLRSLFESNFKRN